MSKSSRFKSPLRPSTATDSVPDTPRETELRQMLLISRLALALCINQLSFLGACQDPTPGPRQSFSNYLHSEIEHLEERDFLTFRNETVKLLSKIQYKAEEHKRQVTTSQKVTTFQVPEATQATAGQGYILNIPDTQPVSIPDL